MVLRLVAKHSANFNGGGSLSGDPCGDLDSPDVASCRVEPPYHGIAHEDSNGLEADVEYGSWPIDGEERCYRDA